MKLKTLEMTFRSTKEFKENILCTRGFFATKFNEYVQLHNHTADKLVYSYPTIQYKVVRNRPLILGVNEGIDVLKEIFDEFDTVKLGDTEYEIIQRSMTIKKQEFGLSDKNHFYEFLTPWLPFNKENYEKFVNLKTMEEQKDMLRRILTGNLLSMSKDLGYTVPDKIICDIDVQVTKSEYKKVDFISFYGGFMVNFSIPDYMGIGKSPAMGMGTVKKIRVYRND
ncbi:MAG: CRISPR-associated endonuclease Cas6 [Euryarchaeota archaeon]|nr:CRISPR-associated endonuclease Cas6 [Euryarchaeota archaeon]